MTKPSKVLIIGSGPIIIGQAAVFEAGIEVENISESGLIDYQELTSFWQL